MLFLSSLKELNTQIQLAKVLNMVTCRYMLHHIACSKAAHILQNRAECRIEQSCFVSEFMTYDMLAQTYFCDRSFETSFAASPYSS